jgi:hypothetical protein
MSSISNASPFSLLTFLDYTKVYGARHRLQRGRKKPLNYSICYLVSTSLENFRCSLMHMFLAAGVK